MTAQQAALPHLVTVGDDAVLNLEIGAELASIWLDRDLSWLQFNARVLAEAFDPNNPLLERVKFLAIVTANLDEFFMKRMAVLIAGAKTGDRHLLGQLRERVQNSLRLQAACWQNELVPALRQQGIHICRWTELTTSQQEEANAFFLQQVYPALTPLIIDSGDNFPFLSNLSTSLVFPVTDPASGLPLQARVKVPASVKSWIPLTPASGQGRTFLRLHELIEANLHQLYAGMQVGPAGLIRLTRDAEVEADLTKPISVLEEVKEQLRMRRYEPVVRLEYSPTVPEPVRALLQTQFRLSPEALYEAADELDCASLFELAGLDFPALHDPPWVPLIPAAIQDSGMDLLAAVRNADLLVHHPYESFDATVQRFIEQAAQDPAVISIKMTVYRVGDDTPFVGSLIRAAEAGKQVACVIELKARFDEERNLHWASALRQAGAHVVHGVKGLKIHGKTALVVRKEADGLRSYAHVGTGNYHARTARLYADVGLFTVREEITRDVVALFHHLTGHSHLPDSLNLLIAPISMRPRFLELIQREIDHAHAGRPARIVAKMNQLEDPEMIEALCRASTAGVSIDLIIRGFCCLRPGVPLKTENIRVRSIIGRFLEHSRIYYFGNGREEWDGDFFIGSADWMTRNLSKRIEVVTPVLAGQPRQRLAQILDICLNDRSQAWTLHSDGDYQRSPEAGEPDNFPTGTHRALMRLALDSTL